MPLGNHRRGRQDIRDGKMIIIVDDDRENRGPCLRSRKITRDHQLYGDADGAIFCPPKRGGCVFPQTSETSSMGTATSIEKAPKV
jgi:hypothetical protein